MDVLHKLFKHVDNMQEFLLQCEISSTYNPSSNSTQTGFLIHGDYAFNTFMETTLVCSNEVPGSPPAISSIRSTQTEVVRRVIDKCKTHKKYCKRILCLGQHKNFPNTMIKSIKSSIWLKLLSIIGDEMMVHLLFHYSIFTLLPNSCYLQVSGVSISDSEPLELADSRLFAPFPPNMEFTTTPNKKRKRDAQLPKAQDSTDIDQDETLPAKKKRIRRFKRKVKPLPDSTKTDLDDPDVDGRMDLDDPEAKTIIPPPVASHLVVPVAPAPALEKNRSNESRAESKDEGKDGDLGFKRRVLYSRPFHGVKNEVLVGLPKIHVLSLYRLQILRKDQPRTPTQKPWPTITAQTILAYIFPRQYGLEHIFKKDSQKSFGRPIPPDYTVRYNADHFHDKPVPKRLRKAFELVQQMIRLHSTCNFKALYNKHCPAPTDLPGSTPLPGRDYMRWTSPFFNVSGFVKAVVRRVIPKKFLSTTHNTMVVFKAIDRFVRLRKSEDMTLQHAIDEFKMSDCEWLVPLGFQQGQHIPLSDTLKRRQLLEDFTFWLFDGFIIPLIKTSFYVTDTTVYRNRIVYFRSDIWKLCCFHIFESLGTSTYKKISEKQAKRTENESQFRVSRVRLVPKKNGLRPILNLRRRFSVMSKEEREDEDELKKKEDQKHGPPKPTLKDPSTDKENPKEKYTVITTTNKILKDAMHILNYEKGNNPQLMGGAVASLTDIYLKLKTFANALQAQSSNGDLPKLYFVKVDITAAFDSIKHDKLLEVLNDVFTDEDYFIVKYFLASAVDGKYSRKWPKKAFPGSANVHFAALANDMAKDMKKTLVADTVVYDRYEKDDIWQMLEEHITTNLVKVGRQTYRQRQGIPQGSVVSALLCSLYYGHLEQAELSFTNQGNDGLLLHYVDDFIYMTSNREKAERFLQVMTRGLPEYSAAVSPHKTMTNFPVEVNGFEMREIDGDDFPWCGHLINTRTLGVTADYSKMVREQFRESLGVDYLRHQGQALRRKVSAYMKPKCHALYFDTSLAKSPHVVAGLDAGRFTVLLNIYQSMRMCAMRFRMYIKQLENSSMKSVKVGQVVLSAMQEKVEKVKVAKREEFLSSTIHGCIRLMNRFVKGRTKTTVAQKINCECRVDAKEVYWLGLQAFYITLKSKQTEHSRIVQDLHSRVNAKKYLLVRKAVQVVITHSCNDIFGQMQY
ncbi:hypothetical protein SmJEL517_g06094 [Synchytrium microbalum]|uniref:Telomerase reverse transcriptase n=1 Tax=Synchytrium microbalum TaxID=1806994 RepID=A0A507BKF3_9FUNG|nr:uncharacterized protein SmJEL517_g06094 [Synchytrium microbalum]TPX30327.1 hypothetical protein SmJEL517_g06094 [Synchytrium microbalum]